jgi:hypothetical protein
VGALQVDDSAIGSLMPGAGQAGHWQELSSGFEESGYVGSWQQIRVCGAQQQAFVQIDKSAGAALTNAAPDHARDSGRIMARNKLKICLVTSWIN